jgi:hypothetical protein
MAGKVNVKNLHNANWVYFETENFKVLTDAKEEKALEIVRELEHFRHFLGHFFLAYEQQPLSEKVCVVAAKNKTSFKSLGMPDNSSGLLFKGYVYVIFTRYDGFISSSKGGSNLSRLLVLHELVHLFLRNSSSELALPAWYDEGIANYFCTYMERDGKVIIGDPTLLKNQFDRMLGPRWEYESVDTESLFKTSNEDLDFWYKRQEMEELIREFYARAFLVAHYMFADIERVEMLRRYLYLLNKGLSVDVSFKDAFSMTFSELDYEIYVYAKGKHMKYMVYSPFKEGLKFPDVEIEKHDMTKRDALGFIYSCIDMLPPHFLGDGNFNRLENDIEKMYPGLITEVSQKLAEKPQKDIKGSCQE